MKGCPCAAEFCRRRVASAGPREFGDGKPGGLCAPAGPQAGQRRLGTSSLTAEFSGTAKEGIICRAFLFCLGGGVGSSFGLWDGEALDEPACSCAHRTTHGRRSACAAESGLRAGRAVAGGSHPAQRPRSAVHCRSLTSKSNPSLRPDCPWAGEASPHGGPVGGVSAALPGL